jgi:hypothetical protein
MVSFLFNHKLLILQRQPALEVRERLSLLRNAALFEKVLGIAVVPITTLLRIFENTIVKSVLEKHINIAER